MPVQYEEIQRFIFVHMCHFHISHNARSIVDCWLKQPSRAIVEPHGYGRKAWGSCIVRHN